MLSALEKIFRRQLSNLKTRRSVTHSRHYSYPLKVTDHKSGRYEHSAQFVGFKRYDFI